MIAGSNFVAPKLMSFVTWSLDGFNRLCSQLPQFIAIIITAPISVIVLIVRTLVADLSYRFQGAGEIEQDYKWGNEYDIINNDQVDRHRMRKRAALRRVWASSWLQWHLDKSIRLGLDLDQREHVQIQQDRAHDDYQRRDHMTQQIKSMNLTSFGVALSAMALISTLLTGGALFSACYAFLCTLLTALLQYASLCLESNRTLEEEWKHSLQNFISIAQSLLMLSSILVGFWGSASAVAEGGLIVEAWLTAGIAVRRIGTYLKNASNWLRNFLGVFRYKDYLKQLNKFLMIFGIGGAMVVLMDIHHSMSGRISFFLEIFVSFVQLKMQVNSMMQKKQEQNQQEQKEQMKEEEKDDEDETCEDDHLTTICEKRNTRTLSLPEATLIKANTSINVKTGNKSGKSEKDYRMQGNTTSIEFRPKNGDVIVIIPKENEDTKEIEASFSSELSDDQKAFLNVRDTTPKFQDILDLFEIYESRKKDVGNTTLDCKIITYFNKEGIEIKKVYSYATEDGEVTVTYVKGKLKHLSVQPKGDPKPAPMFLDVKLDGDMSKKIWGEVTKNHLICLSKYLESDQTAVEISITNDLPQLESLAKRNQEEAKQIETAKQDKRYSNLQLQEECAPESTKAIRTWAWHAILTCLLPIRSLIFNNPVAVWLIYLLTWIEKTGLGVWINELITTTIGSISQAISQRVGAWLPVAADNSVGVNENLRETKKSPVDENAEAVERLFQALFPNERSSPTKKNMGVEKLWVAGILKKIQSSSVVEGPDFYRAVDILTQHLGESMTQDEKDELQRNIKEHGTAKSLFEYLSKIALKQTQGISVATMSKGEAMHALFVAISAGYSRQNMNFFDPPDFDKADVANVVKQLAEIKGFSEGIQQNVSTAKIQADLEEIIREGDCQGLDDYVLSFCKTPVPEEFSVPGMDQEWTLAKDDEDLAIMEKLDQLKKLAWGQSSDESVAKVTRELVSLMSKHVSNLRIIHTTIKVAMNDRNVGQTMQGENQEKLCRRELESKLPGNALEDNSGSAIRVPGHHQTASERPGQIVESPRPSLENSENNEYHLELQIFGAHQDEVLEDDPALMDEGLKVLEDSSQAKPYIHSREDADNFNKLHFESDHFRSKVIPNNGPNGYKSPQHTGHDGGHSMETVSIASILALDSSSLAVGMDMSYRVFIGIV